MQGSASVGGPYRTLAAFSWTRAAFKSCCNKAISNGLSIRGVFEVARFRPGKAVEATPEPFAPPIFEGAPMLVSQRFNQRIGGRQLGGVRSSGQTVAATACPLLLSMYRMS